jgi:hypothetical protein
METKKHCLRCGRVMYVNDYCKPCSRELLNERRDQYFKEHPDVKNRSDFWREIDRIQLEDRRKRSKEKRAIYFNYGIGDKLRSIVRNTFKNKTSKIQESNNELLGCSINEFKKHLESKFSNGMSWDNYGSGGWHIDHVLPCAVYDLKDPDEQKKCFHYSNLQPMWAIENFDKNASFQSDFKSLDLMNQFINTHKMPASAKAIVKTNKTGKTTYRIKFKIH